MTNADVDRRLERLRQERAARIAELAGRPRQAVSSVHGTRVAQPAGARVFDPVTGEEGEVIAHGSENIVRPTADR